MNEERTERSNLVEMLDEVVDLATGLGILLLPLFSLALPGVILLLPLAVPAIPLAIAGGILALPYLLVRRIRRAGSAGARPG